MKEELFITRVKQAQRKLKTEEEKGEVEKFLKALVYLRTQPDILEVVGYRNRVLDILKHYLSSGDIEAAKRADLKKYVVTRDSQITSPS
jgi:hypothetical protein